MRANFLLFTICAGCYAQQFEVASIKAAPPSNGGRMRVGMTGGPGTPNPGLFQGENVSVSGLIMRAYNLQGYQYSGPGSVDSPRFSLSAKVPEGATKDDLRVMLQNFLLERFQLTFHYEQKEMGVYELVIAKNGLKLKESAGTPSDDEPAIAGTLKSDVDGFPTLPPGRRPMMIGKGAFAAQRFADAPMDQLCVMLANRVGKPVHDATGLKGKYDFTLRWMIDGSSNAENPGPTLMEALQEQLGLKLEAKKGSARIFVVDHLEKMPSEN